MPVQTKVQAKSWRLYGIEFVVQNYRLSGILPDWRKKDFSFAEVYTDENFLFGQFAKVYTREIKKFRQF